MKAISSIFENSVENDLLCSDFGQWLLDKYDLADKIYSSPASQIFMLIDKETGDCFVLKAKHNRSLSSDIDALQSLTHPNIVRVYKAVCTEKYTYTIKEFIPGITLEHYVNTNGCLSEEEALRITMELCDILQFLHSRPTPIIYRDLKPANVILTDNQKLKLIDLDSIRLYKDAAAKDTIYLGTEGFAAPEQFGFSQTDVRTDIYTLGTTLFYLLSGQTPVLDKFRLKNIKTIREDISDKVNNIIEKATMFDPDDRYQSIEEFLSAVSSSCDVSIEEQPKVNEYFKKLVSEEKYKFYTIVVLALTSVGILLSALQSNFALNSSPKAEGVNSDSHDSLEIPLHKDHGENSQSDVIEPVNSPGTFTDEGMYLYNENEADKDPDLSLESGNEGQADFSMANDDNQSQDTDAKSPIAGNSSSGIGGSLGNQLAQKPILKGPIKFVLTPNGSETSSEKVLAISFPEGCTDKQYSFDNKEWYNYPGALVITENCTVYARALFPDKSNVTNSYRVDNIVPKLPVFYIQHGLEPEREYVSEEKVFTMRFSQPIGRLQYSFDEKNWIDYDGPMLFTKNCYLFTRAILPNGEIITGGVEINNIQPKQRLYTIDHRVNPELQVSSNKKVVTIIYPGDSLINEYSFDKATWFLYTEPITVTENCYISSRALMYNGQLVEGSIKIDNINP